MLTSADGAKSQRSTALKSNHVRWRVCGRERSPFLRWSFSTARQLRLPTKGTREWTLDIVEKPAGQKGFVVQKKRWVVERTIDWLVKYRQLVKDYEYKLESSKAIGC